MTQPTISHLVTAGQAIRAAQLEAQEASKTVAAQLAAPRPPKLSAEVHQAAAPEVQP